MKDLKPPHDPVEAMGEAYERLLETAMKDVKKVEDKSEPALHRMIDAAAEKAIEVEELSREEAEQISEYLKRDLLDAARYLNETGNELHTWLGFDIELIEDRLAELFAQAADQTTLELMQLKDQVAHRPYHTGEITGPGTLICDQCGEKLHFHKPGRIPPCPKCKATSFHREA